MKLKLKDKIFFEKNGYVIIRSLFNHKECSELYDSLLQFAGDSFEPLLNVHREDFVFAQCSQKINKFFNTIDKVNFLKKLKKCTDIAKKYFIHPKLKRVLNFIYKKKIVGLQTQIIFKKPKTSYSKISHNPHQDNSYGMSPNGLFFSTHIFLKDVSKTNGTIYVYPKTHKFGLFKFQNVNSYQSKKLKHANKVKTKNFEDNKIDIIAKKGDFLIMHGNLIHGSYPNLSKKNSRPIFCGCYIVKGEKYRKGYTADRRELDFD
jgi:hypothetical protein